MSGWLKIHRKLLSWEWYDNPNMIRLWLHLLLKASPVEKEWHGGILSRGQLVTTIAELAEETGMTIKQVRKCMERLKGQTKGKQIEVETTNKNTIVTICNYERYQCHEEDEGQTNIEQEGKQRANKGQTKQRKEESNKEDKENIIRSTIEKERITKVIPKKESLSLHNNNPEGYENYDFSFVADSMKEAFFLWLAYKRERKEKYKSQSSLKVCYNRLVKFSDGDSAKAKMVVEQSMANNYMGLFELKEQNHGTDRRYNSTAAERDADALSNIASFVIHGA